MGVLLRRVFKQGSILVQQVNQYLQQADFPQHVTENRVVMGQLQQRPHSSDAAGMWCAWLQQHAHTEQLFAWHVIEAEDDKLQKLKVLCLSLRELGHTLCELWQCMLWLQDEVVGWVCCIYVPNGIQKHASQAAGFCPQEGILEYWKCLDVTHCVAWRQRRNTQ